MKRITGWMAIMAIAACHRDVQETRPSRPDTPQAVAGLPLPVAMTAADSARVRRQIAARLDSVRAAFQRATPLGAREVSELRQDRNAEQLASAMALGMRIYVAGDAEIDRLRRQHQLVPLGDSTRYWVLRDMDHSVPFVRPDAYAMLLRVGERFHARLDSLGLPLYRMKVTSALRTPDTQADLRRTNSYAARTLSAHEFGTTVDVSHERFAVPADSGSALWPLEAEQLDSLGVQHRDVLEAELGRALADLRDRGILQVMMENQQPVYHFTVARHLTR